MSRNSPFPDLPFARASWRTLRRPLAAAALFGAALAQAQPAHDMSAMPGMDHDQMKGMDHGAMDMAPTARPALNKDGKNSMVGMGDMSGGGMKAMQGGPPPPDARDPDAYSEGLRLGPMPGMSMADDKPYAHLLFDRLEVFRHDGENGQAVDAQAWYGGDINKLWLELDAERSGGRLGATRMEALWNRAIAAYWSSQVGIRHDVGEGPARNWAAFGVQGLAPYWFELQATAYVGDGGRTALRFEAEYELLLTQRLILQPTVKLDLYGKDDPEREIGSGLSSAGAGLRLRYELTRKFAPYIGVVWSRKLGNTAGFARDAGATVQQTKAVAGVRIWF